MFKQSVVAAVAALGSVLTLLAGGVAAAVPPAQEKITAKGYWMSLSIENVNIQAVPNMAAAPLVREGFVTATARLKVGCTSQLAEEDCKAQPVKATLSMSAQVGCSMQLDGGIDSGLTSQITSGLPETLGGFLPEGGDVTQIGITPTVSNLGPGSLKVIVKPGYISDVNVGNKESKFPKDKLNTQETAKPEILAQPVVSVTNRHIVIDQSSEEGHPPTCLGPVAIRLSAHGTLRTATSFDTVDMFGGIFAL